MKGPVPLLLVCGLVLLIMPTRAEDVITLTRKEYKNATVKRAEPDGIVIQDAAGIVKVPFTDLPASYQEKYGYDPEKAAQYSAALAKQQEELRSRSAEAALKLRERRKQQEREEREKSADEVTRSASDRAAKKLQAYTIYAVVEPFSFGKEETTAWIQPYVKYDTGQRKNPSSTSLDMVPVYEWRKDGRKFIGVLDEPMKEAYEQGDAVVVALYKIGHTNDSSRHPLFTSKPEKALALIAAQER
jgi:hypothetical protein